MEEQVLHSVKLKVKLMKLEQAKLSGTANRNIKDEADSESRTGRNLEELKVLSDTESWTQLRVQWGLPTVSCEVVGRGRGERWV